MANEILFTDSPSAETLIASDGTLKNLANLGTAVGAECNNATGMKLEADFELYIHDYAAAPSSGGYFELHLVYALDGTHYGDGEDGDLASPNTNHNTFAGVFPVQDVLGTATADEDQYLHLYGVKLRPYKFKPVIINRCGQAIPNTDGSTLKVFRTSLEMQ